MSDEVVKWGVKGIAQKYVTLTVRLTGRRRFGIRLWIASKLFKLGSFICPIPTVIEYEECEPDNCGN